MGAEIERAIGGRGAIEQAMVKTLEKLDPKKQLKIGILNSGNKGSGIRSNVDQTIFVLNRELANELGVDEAKVIAEFEVQFKKLTGVEPKKAGIASMNGADFYPDWRQKQTVADFVGGGGAAREAEFQDFPREKKEISWEYQATALEYLSLTGDLAAARRYYELAIQTMPADRGKLEMPQELR